MPCPSCGTVGAHTRIQCENAADRWTPGEYVRRIYNYAGRLEAKVKAGVTVGLLDLDQIMMDSLIDAVRDLPGEVR